MTKADILNRIARGFLPDTVREDRSDHAQAMGWVRADGGITDAGSDILDAVNTQDQARSVFRLY